MASPFLNARRGKEGNGVSMLDSRNIKEGAQVTSRY